MRPSEEAPPRSVHDGEVPISPDLQNDVVRGWRPSGILTIRTLTISALAVGISLLSTVTARLLVLLIGLITNLSFYGSFSWTPVNPWTPRLGLWVILLPAIGGVIVGIIARYGSSAIRGHGIPEAMEQVLTNESRIPPRVTLLKPVSSAIAIGTGGPFGAEGPIIATGGALGSLVGQLLKTTAVERKILLAAGAAGGMTAIFGAPIAAVVLAVELLLFELRPQSLTPIALACAAAAGLRHLFFPAGPVFAMPHLAAPGAEAATFYVVLGAVTGVASVVITKFLFLVEDWFEKLPIHWMWWPALGGLVVGVFGYLQPRTLGVGYENFADLLNGNLPLIAVCSICGYKLISWGIALGSGTSGGTLAPLFTVGGGLGALVGMGAATYYPALGVDPRIAALVGMAAIFAGASRALLTSIVFAFETTQQSSALLPLLGGCAAAYFVSGLLMRNTIMTEKIARRGIHVPDEYVADHLDAISVGIVGRKAVVTLSASQRIQEVREWLRSHEAQSEHQGFPVVEDGVLLGVVTRRNLLAPEVDVESEVGDLIARTPVTIGEKSTLREAADVMVRASVGRLPVVDAAGNLVGIITRSDLLHAHMPRLDAQEKLVRTIPVRRMLIKSRLIRGKSSAKR